MLRACGGDDGRELIGGIVGGHVVDVAHRRGDVGMPGVRLHLMQPVGPDGHRAVGVAQVVKANALEARAGQRRPHPAPERRLLDHAPGGVREDQVIRPGEVLALRELVLGPLWTPRILVLKSFATEADSSLRLPPLDDAPHPVSTELHNL